ncbi:unnamed protein product, partial [Vitis vinifera]
MQSFNPYWRRKKKSVSLLMQNKAIDIMEDGASDSEIYLQDANDEEEHYYTSSSISKLQFRKDVSKAIWNDAMRMAEVVEMKGKMWTTTGMLHSGKIYCSIEETLFLAELGALHLLDDNDVPISLKGIYDKVSQGKCGCCWESFEAYRHLKSLGYIVGRHGIPWTSKGAKTCLDSHQGTPEGNSRTDEGSEEENSTIELVNNMHITEVKLLFDVYLPNSKFRKSSPGDPSFVLCLTRGHPPLKTEIEDLERRCGSIPFKFFHVSHGRVSFFSFNRVELPVLP